MAKKIRYRATSIEHTSPEKLAGMLQGAQTLVVAIDVAKTKMVAGFGSEDGSTRCLVKWTSPFEKFLSPPAKRGAHEGRCRTRCAESRTKNYYPSGAPVRCSAAAGRLHLSLLIRR